MIVSGNVVQNFIENYGIYIKFDNFTFKWVDTFDAAKRNV